MLRRTFKSFHVSLEGSRGILSEAGVGENQHLNGITAAVTEKPVLELLPDRKCLRAHTHTYDTYTRAYS